MTPRLSLVAFFTVALFAAAQAQDVKVEKYKLDNGITVILHEDHSLPVGAINLWYRVGSKDEPAKRSGFAHLFEHLMFMGTQRVPGNKFDTIMESAGGSNNASTSSDRTNYFSSGPAQLLPTLLWLDADRLEDLSRTMDQEKLDKQRDVVRNERRQSYENRPYGMAELELQGMMYPEGHPYHIPVIGTHEDLEAATVDDVNGFFDAHYVPNNMSLCVAGDFDAASMKKTIAGLFGSIPKRPDPPHKTAPPVKLDKEKRATVHDKVQVPKIIFAYHSPGQFTDGDAEMDLLAAVLSEGKSSRLYKRLVYDDKIASEVTSYQDSSQLGSVFRIDVMVNPGVELEKVEKAVDEELTKIIEVGPGQGEVEQRKATFELNMLSRLQSIDAKADQLNAYEYFWGEPNSFKRDLDRYRNATADSLKKYAKQVLTPQARVVMRVLPQTGDAPAAVKKPDAIEKKAVAAAGKKSEPAPRPASERDKQPAIGAPPKFGVPTPELFKLANGIPVELWRKPELPLVAGWVIFRPGHIFGMPSRAGSMYLAADMLDEGAGDLDALAFSDQMQSLGARFRTGADREAFQLNLTVLKRNFEPAASMMVDAIQEPKFDPLEWERVKRLHLEDLKQEDDQPTLVASKVAARTLFGDQHMYGWPMAGTVETVAKIEMDDIKLPFLSFVRPEYARVLIAGDVTVEEAKAALDKNLGAWKSRPLNIARPEQPSLPQAKELRVYIVDRPDAVQTVIQFMLPGPKYNDQYRVNYRLLNTLFGGSFTSRLNMNLRENHGYTYGARSGFSMREHVGYVSASSSVRADVTGAALEEFLGEFKRVRGGDVSAEEATKARETVRTDVIQSFSGLGGILGEAYERIAGGLHFETLARDLNAMQSVTVDDLNKIAASAFPLEKGVLVLVGDKKLILDQIKDLGLPAPVELNVHGEKVGS